MLSIRLLGTTEVYLDGKRLTISRRKSRALLYFLAAHPQPVSRSRVLGLLWADHTPETARSNLRSTLYSLRQSIGDHLVADTDTLFLAEPIDVDVRALTAAGIEPRAHASPVTSAPVPQELAQMLARYGGDFLADFNAPGAPELEEWITLERERLRRLVIRGYEILSRHYAQRGALMDALRAVEQALMLDPFQEDLQRTALLLHHQAGDRAGAIRRFEEFRRLLDEEMGVPPMAETHTLYDAIITDSPLPAASATFLPLSESLSMTAPPPTDHTLPPALAWRTNPVTVSNSVAMPAPASLAAGKSGTGNGFTVPFTGRAQEVAHLTGWINDRRLLFIEGEPGLGKTSLIQHFMGEELPQLLGATPILLEGRGRELEYNLPYQPLIEALRSISRHPAWPQWRAALQLAPLWQLEIARLLPELCPAAAWENRSAEPATPKNADASRLWEAVYQWLAALAQIHPVALFFDDLHWADPSTLGLTGYLTRRMAGETVSLYLLAAGHPSRSRSDSATLLQTLMREELLHRLVLEPLDAQAVTELARQLSPQYGHPLASWLYRSSEGTPFILVHLLRHARESGILSEDGTVDLHRLPTTPVVPQTVYTVIQNRLESLSESARRVLDAAVAVGREFEFEVVARAAALSDTAALDALDELRHARLIQEVSAERFAFTHTLIREVAHREVGEIRHRLLHRRVGAALESLYTDRIDEIAGLLAHHYSEGNASEQAYPHALRAAQHAASIAAWQPATGFFEQALRFMPSATPGRERLGILMGLGKAHLHAGQMQEATTVLRQAVDESRSISLLDILREALQALGEALINQAHYQEVIELAESMQEITDPHVRFTLDFMRAAGLSVGGTDLATAARYLMAAEARLAGATDLLAQVRLAQIAFELGGIDAQQGRLEDAVARYRQSLTLTASHANEDMVRWHILAQNNLAYHLHLLNDPSAIEHARQGYELARERGFLNMNGYLLSTLGEISLAQGDLVQAEDYFAQGLALAHRLAQLERIAGLTANLGRIAQARGQIDQARDRYTTALELALKIANRHLSAQIRVWLAPLLSTQEAMQHLAVAREIIESADYGRLRTEWEAVHAQLVAA